MLMSEARATRVPPRRERLLNTSLLLLEDD
jgi:hypothetical protein